MINGHQLLLKVIVGSQAYGTSTPESDIDYCGVYMQDVDEILQGNYLKQVNINKDEKYYEVNRFLNLLETNNPTVMEFLNTPEECIIYKHPLMDDIIALKEKFITKQCKYSIGGYVRSQLKKARGLEKKMNWEKEKMVRKTPLDFCFIYIGNEKTIPLRKWLDIYGYEQSSLGLTKINNAPTAYAVYANDKMEYKGVIKVKNGEETGNEVRISSILKGEKNVAVMYYNENSYKSHCKNFREYQKWLKDRNTARYVDIEEHGQVYDGKNLLHVKRLLDMSMEIAQGKGVIIRRPNAKELLDIRKGRINLENFFNSVEDKLKEVDKAYDNCDLPEEIEIGLKDKILRNIRQYQLKKQYNG